MTTITVLTATYNSAAVLQQLVTSLEAQTDTDFEWVVSDGASTDSTLAIVAAARLRKHVLSGSDFGIYDALNKGLRVASGDYYLVVGSDDVLMPDAIANYRRALVAGGELPDMVTAAVMASGIRSDVRPGKAWLYGLRGHVSQHSVGVLVRRDLHERFGYYSRRFPIAADQYFIKTAANGGAKIRVADFVAGEFGQAGTSSMDAAGTLTEFFRVQLLTERHRAVQVLLFLLRLLKNFRRL